MVTTTPETIFTQTIPSTTTANATKDGSSTTNTMLATPLLNLALPGKFKLPEFDHSNPEVWFAASDIIFAANGVQSEQAKFSSLLQHLDTTRLQNVQSVISDQLELQPYTKAKQIILNLYAEPMEKKFERLFNGARIQGQVRPSHLLQEIQRLSQGMAAGENFIKNMWLQKLPVAIRPHLVQSENLPLQELVKVADILHSVLPPSNSVQPQLLSAPLPIQQPSMVATIQQPDILTNMMTVIQNLAAEVAAIKSRPINDERQNRRTYGYNYNYRSRSQSRPRRSYTPTPKVARQTLYDGLCWFHYTFQEQAYKCAGGACKKASESTGNE